jgi:hypothetical protein
VGYVDVYRNGVYLPSADYTATTGTTVVLNNGATVGDTITTISFYVSSVLNAIPATAGAVNSTYLASSLTLTTPTLTSPTMSGAVLSSMASSVITSGTAQASTSGTSIDFTSIPSWVKRISVMFAGVSTNGSSIIQAQIGAGSVQTTGYTSGAWLANTSNTTSTTGFIISGTNSASYLFDGILTLTLLNSSTGLWVYTSTMSGGASNITSVGGGNKTLSGTLDRVRITTVNGTDTFDAGSVNILYE